jgi:hypothetical protein
MRTVHVLNKTWNVEMAVLALDCVASHVLVRNSPNSWAIQRRLIRHAARCWSLVEDGIIDDDSRAWALHCLGYLSLYLTEITPTSWHSKREGRRVAGVPDAVFGAFPKQLR